MSVASQGDWSIGERRAWRPVRPLRVSDWAERHRVLSPDQSSIPGPWRNANAPFLIGIMNIFALDHIEHVVIEKAAQMGVSEALRNVIGRYAHQEPDPCLFVMPTEADGREIISRRIKPLFSDTPVLRQLHTGVARDVRLNAIVLNNSFYLRLGYAGSPTSLKSHPIRIVVLDEVDDYPVIAGQPDPVALAEKRTRTYGRRRKIAYVSTPSTEDGLIHRLRLRSPIQLSYFVPCPSCGRYQPLHWDRLKWPAFENVSDRAHRAAQIEISDTVRYSCCACPAAIPDAQRRWMVQRGAWAVAEVGQELRWNEASHRVWTPAGEEIEPGDLVLEGWPAGRQVAFHLSALYSLAVEWPTLAAEFVRLQGDLEALQDFVNQTLGEPWHQNAEAPNPEVLAACIDEHRMPGVPPKDALVLTAGVDVQQDRIYYVVRAWGYDSRSWLVQHGMLPLDDESLAVLDVILQRTYGQHAISMSFIDSGYKPSLVYEYCGRVGRGVGPSKGANSDYAPPVRTVLVERLNNGKPAPAGLQLYLINSSHWKTWVHAHSRVNAGDPGEWRLHGEVDQDYQRQILAEARVARTRAGRVVHEWKLINRTAGSHYLDCEALAAAAAWFPLGIHRAAPPPEPVPHVQHDEEPSVLSRYRDRGRSWIARR